MKNALKIISTLVLVSTIAACGPNKKDISMRLHSDPLGAYALLKLKYKGNENSEWIYLGPTPIVTNKKIITSGASAVTLKVVRPGFYEQEKTWKMKDFLKEHKKKKVISWIPNMVKQ